MEENKEEIKFISVLAEEDRIRLEAYMFKYKYLKAEIEKEETLQNAYIAKIEASKAKQERDELLLEPIVKQYQEFLQNCKQKLGNCDEIDVARGLPIRIEGR